MFAFSNIIEIDTTCQAVYAAIKAHTFITTTMPNDIYSQFTTPGWVCGPRSPTSGKYCCSRSTASFSFFEGV